MRDLLLDTHVWLWIQAAPERVSPSTRAIIDDDDSRVHLSHVSAWEIAIKYSVGKLPLSEPPSVYIRNRLQDEPLELVPITLDHVLAVSELAHHHGDPFDRLLIAQAQALNLELVTADSAFAPYGIALIPAR